MDSVRSCETPSAGVRERPPADGERDDHGTGGRLGGGRRLVAARRL
ncbi:hypothetical protein [Micromonospora andamanensis]|nr:hypothetical protein [Micromonospora andamanensis]